MLNHLFWSYCFSKIAKSSTRLRSSCSCLTFGNGQGYYFDDWISFLLAPLPLPSGPCTSEWERCKGFVCCNAGAEERGLKLLWFLCSYQCIAIWKSLREPVNSILLLYILKTVKKAQDFGTGLHFSLV